MSSVTAMKTLNFLLYESSYFKYVPSENFSHSHTAETHQVGKFNKEKLVLHLQWSIISWSSFSMSARKFKTKFLCAERMFDHFLPATIFYFRQSFSQAKLFFYCLMQHLSPDSIVLYHHTLSILCIIIH